jgi:ectoine hydroxylase-related dioxygenase (phytanoyl-CoA dioxygenase family)
MPTVYDAQLREFAERGYLVFRDAVPPNLIEDASRLIDDLLVEQPPAAEQRGAHFPHAKRTKDFLPLLLESSVLQLAEALVGIGRVTMPRHVQIALNIPPRPHRPGRPHLDGVTPPETDGRPGTFTLLAGILITDQVQPDMGNLWVWPGTHLTHAELFRINGPDALIASRGVPDIDLPEPTQILGKAGDVVLAHYLLGHNIGGNVSPNTRRAVYFRLKRDDHVANWRERIQHPLLDFDGVRAALAR